MRKMKKSILIISFLIMIFPIYIYATVTADIDGKVYGGYGNSGSTNNHFNLMAIGLLKVSLVDISSSNPMEKTSHYYAIKGDAHYTNFSSLNYFGANTVCGYIDGTSKYNSGCETIESSDISLGNNWFRSGLYFSSESAKMTLADDSFLQGLLNILTVKADIGEYDLTNLTNEQKTTLNSYRIVLEPVYAFLVDTSTNFGAPRAYFTLKGITQYMADYSTQIANRELNNVKTGLGLSVVNDFLINNVFASNTHGSINPSGLPSLGGAMDQVTIYRGIGDVNAGYGYGIFSIIDEVKDCDPKKQCCYDESGNYHKEYTGATTNYKCTDGVNGQTCANQKLTPCKQQMTCSVNETLNSTCGSATRFSNTTCRTSISSREISACLDCGCGKGYVTADATIIQTGTINFPLPNTSIFSGGGFEYSVNYSNSATWMYNSNPECPLLPARYEVQCPASSKANKCCRTRWIYSPECSEKDSPQAESLIEEKIVEIYKGLDDSTGVVKLPDSNDVTNTAKNTNTGKWDCNSDNVGSSWKPGTILNSKCTFTLQNAYIDKQTGIVSYGNNYDTNNYLSEGAKYFTPLKYVGNFPIVGEFNDLSSVYGYNWNANYECGVDCKSKYYNDTPTGFEGYKFYYRPIDLSNPFPNNRVPGNNWIKLYNENKGKSNNRLTNTYNNLEYSVSLTNETINMIKEYNKNQYNGYLDYSILVNPYDGESSFINSNSSFIDRTNNAIHSGLGICDKDCIGGGTK